MRLTIIRAEYASAVRSMLGDEVFVTDTDVDELIGAHSPCMDQGDARLALEFFGFEETLGAAIESAMLSHAMESEEPAPSVAELEARVREGLNHDLADWHRLGIVRDAIWQLVAGWTYMAHREGESIKKEDHDPMFALVHDAAIKCVSFDKLIKVWGAKHVGR